MRRDALGKALREVPVPPPADGERRGLELVEAAYAEREGGRGGLDSRWPLPRLALALGIATVFTALLLSPAGAAVRDWVGDVVGTSAPRPEPALSEIPGGGRLLVQSASGPWVVQADGSRRLLGDYEEASWSPRGLFVAVAKGRTLTAVEPDGTPRWSITAAARAGQPRWSPSGERIAYRSGQALRIVAGDGSGDRVLARSTAPVAPSWSPAGDPGLAYVSAAGMLRIVNSERAEGLAAAPALPDVAELEWGAAGAAILEASRRALRLRAVHARKLPPGPALGEGRALPIPAGATVVDAAAAPRRAAVAATLTFWREHGTRSAVVVFGPGAEQPRRLLTVPGSLGQVAWSPDGRRLLVAWPAADQWLFLPTARGQGRAVADISRAFSPGGPASFPRIEGWCCRR